ncbi:unnamed protein product [Linum trigynum]|uniref:Uncharacterized protein n=1 Tax=Linum trigynum TaxID=586398 RepID=A0AAV2CJ58_9ROSI
MSSPKQSRLNEKWQAFRKKMQGNPVFKRFSGISELVVTKSQDKTCGKDGRQVKIPLFTKSNMTVSVITSLKKQMLQHLSRKYVDMIHHSLCQTLCQRFKMP